MSSYFNWQTDVNSEPNYETNTIEAEIEAQLVAADDHHLEYYWNAFELPLDSYTDINNYILHPQNYTTSLLPYDQIIPYEENIRSYQITCPKRQKQLIEDHYCSDLMPGVFDGVALSPYPVFEGHQSMNQVKCKKTGDGEKCASVQSIAARERRGRKLLKRHELGKLVPGGTKMNTAEMLDAAFKYIKYLQAQLGILQVMDSFHVQNMEILRSPKVQEKLYLEDKCLVPKDVVLSLIKLSKPPLSHELNRLLSLAPHA